MESATFAVMRRRAFGKSKKLLEWRIGRKTPVVDCQIVWWGIVSDFQDIQETQWEAEC
jgi:hypothetical protein